MKEQRTKRKNWNRWFSILLTVVFCFTLMPATASAAELTDAQKKAIEQKVMEKINDLEKDYPTGSYFSVDGKPCTSKNCSTNCNIKNVAKAVGQPWWNKAGDASQCMGFTRYAYYYIFNEKVGSLKAAPPKSQLVSNGNSHVYSTYANAKPGDVITFFNASGSRTHWGIFISADTSGVKVFNANVGTTAEERAGLKTTKVECKKYAYGGDFLHSKVEIRRCPNYYTKNYDAYDYSGRTTAKTNNNPPATQTFTVIFNANGGVISGDSEKTVAKNSTLGTLPTASKTGYKFNGWFASDGSQAKTSTKVTKNITYTAKFTKAGATTTPPAAPAGKQFIKDGIYTLTPKSGPIHMRLDIASGSKNNGANAQLYTANTSAAQEFRFKFDKKTGTYTITNVNSGKVLDVADGSKISGTNVQQWSSNGTNAQKWKLTSAGSGYYYLSPAVNESLVLDVKSAGTTNNTNVQVWTKNNSSAQQWKIQPVSEKTYYVKGTDGLLNINKIASSGQKIGQIPEGSAVTIDTSIKSGGWWYGSYNGVSGYIASNYLTATKPVVKPAVKPVIQDGTYEVSPKHASDMRLDVKSASKENKAVIQIYKDNNTDAQKFRFKHLGNNYYSITNVNSNKVLDVTGGSSKAGTYIQQYGWADVPAQRWKVTSAGNGYYYLSPDTNESLVLTVVRAEKANGTRVLTWTNNGNNHQQWKLTK